MIKVTKVNGYNRSCNECDARNYKSRFDPPEAKPEDIYELEIGTFCIAVCRKCLREVKDRTAEFHAKLYKDIEGDEICRIDEEGSQYTVES